MPTSVSICSAMLAQVESLVVRRRSSGASRMLACQTNLFGGL
ncbi:hypothetical protein [Micromonospora orduensis]